ncbi:hypothetical protein IMCC3135_28490 [Granulosicoccus antarcticus IMCC3135]|uniref:Uncharacterized protein n=1 Tax=Granulosicoccus antarcticus IMCC3135 TaxID=1192854 RepID=A0A2Z2P2Z1_9GAMM|nr:hypothetical protein IMCC3135_28490 [Granulosicoccus antarcticus IMCC3135]
MHDAAQPAAGETRIEVTDPVYGNVIAEVRMCPVNLERLEALINGSSEQGRRERQKYAFELAQLGG